MMKKRGTILALEGVTMTKRTTRALLGITIAASCAGAWSCVGDEPAAQTGDAGPTSDGGGSDGSVGADSSPPADSGADSGPTCLPPSSPTPGILDPTFGSSFKSITNGFVPFAFAIDTAGNSYVAGQAFHCVSASTGYDFAVVRFKPNGDVDATFNPSLKPLCFDFGTGGETAQAIAIAPDGKIVVAGLGGGDTATYGVGVVRFDSNGTLDPGFGTAGRVSSLYASNALFAVHTGHFVSPQGIAFFGDKIVLTGADDSNGSNRTTGFVARLNHDGSLDSSFAGTAIYADSTHVNGFMKAAVEADGSLAVVGVYGANVTPNFLVEKLTTAGALDPSFGTSGIYQAPALVGSDPQDIPHWITRLENGDYLIAGAADSQNGVDGTAAAIRIDSTGHPVTSFGTNGVFTGPNALVNQTLVLDTPIAPLCGGDAFYVGKKANPDGGVQGDIGILHVSADGKLDTTFGSAGLGAGALSQVVNVIAVAEDPSSNKPVVIATNPSNQVGVFRFEP